MFSNHMTTLWLLMAQYEGAAVVPIERVAADHFGVKVKEGGLPRFLRKLDSGEIPLPVTRMETSRKGLRGVHLLDLAAYIDARRAAGEKELRQLQA